MVDVFWVDLCKELKAPKGSRQGNAVRLKDYEKLEAEIAELKGILERWKIYESNNNDEIAELKLTIENLKVDKAELKKQKDRYFIATTHASKTIEDITKSNNILKAEAIREMVKWDAQSDDMPLFVNVDSVLEYANKLEANE